MCVCVFNSLILYLVNGPFLLIELGFQRNMDVDMRCSTSENLEIRARMLLSRFRQLILLIIDKVIHTHTHTFFLIEGIQWFQCL